MRCIFLGCTSFSREHLINILSNEINVVGVFTSPEYFNISYSEGKVKNQNYTDLTDITSVNDIPLYWVDSVKGKRLIDYQRQIKELSPDLILVLGWYYMVPKEIRDLAKYGAWGIHASLLPKYAGGAPLNWAIINGEKETGVSLFRLGEGVDDGDIIDQKVFPIYHKDTIKEVYARATEMSKEILIDSILNISKVVFKPQDKNKIEVWPQRKPNDGEIDLTQNAIDIYNFIRAQSAPYPGAYIKTVDGKKLIIESARIEEV